MEGEIFMYSQLFITRFRRLSFLKLGTIASMVLIVLGAKIHLFVLNGMLWLVLSFLETKMFVGICRKPVNLESLLYCQHVVCLLTALS
jgi:hypothetical protein